MKARGSMLQHVTERLNAHNAEWLKMSEAKGGRSSAGRAPALHAGGQEFDPPRLHQIFGGYWPCKGVVEYRFCQNRMHFKSVLCSGKTEREAWVSRSSLKIW